MTKSQPDIIILTPDRQIDRRILLAADSLEAAGWKVLIISISLDKPASSSSRVGRVGVFRSRHSHDWKVLNAYHWIRSNLPVNGGILAWMKRIAWRYFVDQEKFYFNLFHDTLSEYQPLVLIANDLPVLPVAAYFAAKSGAKLVYDSHELFCEQDFSLREKNRWKQIESKYIGACDQIITVNDSIAAELSSRYGVVHANVIYNAERIYDVKQRKRLFHKKFNLSGSSKILLLQGGLTPGRNLDVLVRSMKYVASSSVVLVVLGCGAMLGKLRAISKEERLSGRVLFHEAVPQEALLGLTASADAGVIPYRATCLNSYFCTPNKLFEFLAVGLPILSTDLPEISKIIKGHDVGLVGDTSSPRRFAALIDLFFSDENRLSAWRANALQFRKTMCWELEGEKYVSVVSRLI